MTERVESTCCRVGSVRDSHEPALRLESDGAVFRDIDRLDGLHGIATGDGFAGTVPTCDGVSQGTRRCEPARRGNFCDTPAARRASALSYISWQVMSTRPAP